MRRLLLLLGLLPGTAHAADVDTLLSALKKSLVAEARGTAVVEVAFPPTRNPVRQARLLPRLGAVPALIRRNFTVTLDGQEVLAGRTALRYSLVARNPQAAPWTIWVDSVWNVPLAYQEQRQDGTLARRAAFLAVNAAPARLNTPLSVRAPDPALKKALLAAVPGLKLPAGFEPLSLKLRTTASGNVASEVVLSDGLNVLALIASKNAVKAAPGVAVRRLGGAALWLVGNLPQGTLEAALGGVQTLDIQAVSDLTGTFAPHSASEP